MNIVKIADYFGTLATAVAADGDTSVTIADLAMFTEFNDGDIGRYSTAPHMIAFDALEEEYGPFEKADGQCTQQNGCWMSFKDGSTIRIAG